MPYLKFSVPVFGGTELTLSDFSLLSLAFVNISLIKKIDRRYAEYLMFFLLFNVLILFSIFQAREYTIFLRDYIPNIFAFLIIVTTLILFSGKNNLGNLIRIRNVLCIALILSAIPAYMESLTGIKLPLFYDKYMWRYAFLAQNPNQYGVASILFMFLIIIIDMMFKRKNIKYNLILLIICLVPMLYSGSRTAILSFSIGVSMILFFLFSRFSILQKVIITPIVGILLVVGVTNLLIFMKGKGGQINRALSIFEQIDKGENIGEIEGGTGISINEAVVLFRKYPIFGVGIGNKVAHSRIRVEIHNTYLKFLAETGIIGFIGFLLIFTLPLITILGCHTDLLNKFIILIFYLIFAAMNYPHMLLRQRWVWFFMVMVFIIGKIANDEYRENQQILTNA